MMLNYLESNMTKPNETGAKIIAHICNIAKMWQGKPAVFVERNP